MKDSVKVMGMIGKAEVEAVVSIEASLV